MFILTFLFINNPEKNYHSLKNTVFNIDDNKAFLSTKSALELFLKDHVTLKTGVMMLKIQLYQ